MEAHESIVLAYIIIPRLSSTLTDVSKILVVHLVERFLLTDKGTFLKHANNVMIFVYSACVAKMANLMAMLFIDRNICIQRNAIFLAFGVSGNNYVVSCSKTGKYIVPIWVYTVDCVYAYYIEDRYVIYMTFYNLYCHSLLLINF